MTSWLIRSNRELLIMCDYSSAIVAEMRKQIVVRG